MNDREMRMECLRLAVSVRHLIPADVKTVEVARAYYDFATNAPGPSMTLLSVQGGGDGPIIYYDSKYIHHG